MSETQTAATQTAAAQQPAEALTPALPSPIAYDPDNAASLLLDRGAFAQIQRVGSMLAASEMVPSHLRGKPADCALVVAQAFRWGLDPLAVAQATYVVRGKYGYEGKLIAALVNTSGRTKGPLQYTFSGPAGKREVMVSATLTCETEPREIRGSVEGWATDNEQWRKNPDSMLRYRGAREWARAHMPEIILGIQAEDEIEAPPIVMDGMSAGAAAVAALGSYGVDPLAEKLKAQQAQAAGKAAAADADRGAEPSPEEQEAIRQRELAEMRQAEGREPGEDDDEPSQTTLPGAQATAAHVDRPATGRRGVR